MEIVHRKNLEILEQRKQRVIKFLIEKGMIAEGKTDMVITFKDGKKISLLKLFVEFLDKLENYPFYEMLMKVQQFHDTFTVPTRDTIGFPTLHEQELRYKLIMEEAQETLSSYVDDSKENHGDPIDSLVEAMDGLGDQLYIVLGSFLVYGMRKEAIKTFLAIHDSNMTKLGEDGKPIYREEDGKVIKGPNYEKPTIRIKQVLSDALNNL